MERLKLRVKSFIAVQFLGLQILLLLKYMPRMATLNNNELSKEFTYQKIINLYRLNKHIKWLGSGFLLLM